MQVVYFLCFLCQVYSPPADGGLACEVCHQCLSVTPISFHLCICPKSYQMAFEGSERFLLSWIWYTWSTLHTPRIMSQAVRAGICRNVVCGIVKTLSINPVTMFWLEGANNVFFFLCIVSSRQRQTLPWWKMLKKKAKWHIADFNSQPCFSALVTAWHIIPVLLYIFLMNRIFHGEAEFCYLVANWAEVTVVSVLFELQLEGSQGRESVL